MILLFFVTVLTTYEVTATSIECTISNFICTGPATVKQCVDGIPLGPEYDCPANLICDINTLQSDPCVAVYSDEICCEEGIFPVKDDCKKYYICVNSGLKYLQYFGACAPGYEFSKYKKQCIELENAGCSVPLPTINRTTDAITTESYTIITSTPITQPITTASSTTTTTTVSNSTSTKSNPTTTIIDYNLKCNVVGIIADESSCRHYYICTWATQTTLKATRKICVAGLFYDIKLGQCVFSTDCGERAT